MLIVTPLSPGAARYYFRGQAAGWWVGAGIVTLGLAGQVTRPDLVAVLRGCHPADGSYLPARKPARRRAGWDLTLAAPKSVSLLGALAADQATTVAAAHRSAVVEMLAEMETRYLGCGAVAAGFAHCVNAAGEPHVHTHLVLANLAPAPDGGWSALPKEWWTARRALGAAYQLGLRHHLGASGLDLDWRLRDDGLADLAGVPRAAIRSASSRQVATVADQVRFAGGHHEGPQRASLRQGGRVRTRVVATARPWRDGTAAAGFGAGEADRLGTTAGGDRPAEWTDRAGDLNRAVTARLAASRSAFRHRDVVVALAACWPAGCTAAAAGRWADRFCEAAIARAGRPGAPPRFTTPQAQRADQRLREQLTILSRGGGGRRVVEAQVIESRLDRHDLTPAARSAAEQLVCSPGLIAVLAAPPGRSNFLAHAALLEAAAEAWEAGGLCVAVETASRSGTARWRALSGIEAFVPSSGADIVIVDQADRRTSPEMLAVLARINRGGARPVLVEGGTSPRLGWMRSDVVAELAFGAGRLDPGEAPAWRPRASGPGGAGAAGALLSEWAERWSSRSPARPVLVGLGPAEVDGLNQAARAILADRGAIAGPVIRCRGRPVQAGDHLLVLRLCRSAGGIAPGTVLAVTEVDATRNRLHLRWGRERAVLPQADSGGLGYAYATTPAVAARLANPLLVLATSDALGRQRERIMMARTARPREVDTPGREWGIRSWP
jgi:conjugative relaxase-like TrwC/TraI family protein